MDQWIELRHKIRNQNVPLRQLAQETGIHRKTLRKIRDNSQPPGYQQANHIEKTKIDPYLKRIWERLQTKGFDGGYTIINKHLRQG